MKKLVITFVMLAVFVLSSSGCTWMGRMTAKTEKGLKKAANSVTTMDDKFKHGYEEEKKK